MSATSATPLYDIVRLPEWEYEGPVTFFEERIYFSLRLLCDFLDVKAQEQILRIQKDRALDRFLRQVPIKTRTGVRETWAIERGGIGWWIATIRRDAVREGIRERVIEFQEALIREADRRFWSESEHNPLAALRAELITLERKFAELQQENAQLKEENTSVVQYALSLEARIARLEEQRR